jgi:hypothetical protein
MALSFDSAYDNEFSGVDMRLNSSDQKPYKFKYKDRIQNLPEQRSNLRDVLDKINLLKKVRFDSNQTEHSR